jgi:hypothetical protein
LLQRRVRCEPDFLDRGAENIAERDSVTHYGCISKPAWRPCVGGARRSSIPSAIKARRNPEGHAKLTVPFQPHPGRHLRFSCNESEPAPFKVYECSIKLAPQSAFTRLAIFQSQVAYAGG